MQRTRLVLGGLLSGVLAVGLALYFGLIPTEWGVPAPAEVTAAVEAVIRQSVLLEYQANHTLDTALLATVYVNDPRGGPLDASEVAFVRAAHPNERLDAAQLRWLDYKEATYAQRIAAWANALAQLRRKEAAGTLTNDEQQILNTVDGTNIVIPTATPRTPPTPAPSYADPRHPYPAAYPPGLTPAPTHDPLVAYPGYEPPPTVDPASITPPQPTVPLPFHDPDPATLSPTAFTIHIWSVRVKGEAVKAIVERNGWVGVMTLVNISGQWYIAGERTLKRAPCCG